MYDFENPDLFYTTEQLEKLLKRTKSFLDSAYFDTQKKYGKNQANTAMYQFFANNDCGFFTGAQTRKGFKQLTYHYNEIYQILLDFACSSYILAKERGIKTSIKSLDEIHKYVDENDTTLDYSPKKAVEVVALATAENTYWTTNLIACNKNLKSFLIEAFIEERYSSFEHRSELDNTKKLKLVKLSSGKELWISKVQLNKDINNMIRDDFHYPGYFDPINLFQTKVSSGMKR